MSARPFHKRYHSDALAGFMSLSLEERGAYQTVLDMIYDHGGPIHDNERLLAGYMQCSVRKWKMLREALLSKGKIYLTRDGMISNSRAEKEFENDAKTARKLAENGSKGGRARVENEKKPNENKDGNQATLNGRSSLNHIPETRDTIPNGMDGEAVDPVKILFDLGVGVMTAAGSSEREARSLIGKWRKGHGDAIVIEAFTDCRARAITNPVEWMPKRLASARREGGQQDFLGSMQRRYGAK